MTDRGARGESRAATVSDYTERELITRITGRQPTRPDWLVVGIGDDAAVVEPERNRLDVLSVDCVVEGVHFDRGFVPPDAIGHRALAVSLSDLAAMGAAPRLALASMALPARLPIADFDGIIDGLTRLAARHRLHIVGGNLTRTPGPLTIDITVSGTVKRRQALTRSGARAGDDLYVTGVVGSAAAGLEYLIGRQSAVGRANADDAADRPLPADLAADRRLPADLAADRRLPTVQAYWYPEPRIRVGTLLARNRVAAACVDLSDGLADAVGQVAEASGVGAAIEGAALPIDPAARAWFTERGSDPIRAAIAGGDDYELLVAVRRRFRRRFEAAMRRADVPLTRIGVCTDDGTLTIDGAPLPAGFGHFR